MENLNIVKREELNELTNEEIQSKLEASVVMVTAEVNELHSVDEVKALEEKLMEDFKANDEYLSKVTYELAPEVEYDECTYKCGELVDKIISFINRMEVEFRATLGIYQTIRYWETKGTEPVAYAAFDSTLRMLGTLKYQGKRECRDILAVNNWFAGAHDRYVRDNVYTNYLASIHQALMTQMEAIQKNEVPNDSEPVELASEA